MFKTVTAQLRDVIADLITAGEIERNNIHGLFDTISEIVSDPKNIEATKPITLTEKAVKELNKKIKEILPSFKGFRLEVPGLRKIGVILNQLLGLIRIAVEKDADLKAFYEKSLGNKLVGIIDRASAETYTIDNLKTDLSYIIRITTGLSEIGLEPTFRN